MEVVIFCGGLGTRMREETEFKPKPMVEIGDKPILWHLLKTFSYHGFNEFIFTLGYNGAVIKEYFLNYKLFESTITINVGKPDTVTFHEPPEDPNWQITLVDTGRDTLKAGRLKRVENYINGEKFIVTYGDGLSDINLNDLCEFHNSHGKLATITGINPSSMFGKLIIEGNKVIEFQEKPTDTQNFVNGGYFVFDRRILDFLTDNNSMDLETHVLAKLAKEDELMVYRHNGFWACMDTQRDIDFLNDLWHQGEAPWKVW